MPVSPVFKGTLFYGADVFGWSETYWLNAPDIGTAGVKLGTINDAGMGLRFSDVKLVGARVVDASSPRVSTLPDTSSWKLTGQYTGAATKTLSPDLAILFRTFDAGNLHRSRIFFRGLPSDFLGADHGGPELTITYPGAALTPRDAYEAAVKANALMTHRLAKNSYDEFPIDHVVHSTTFHIRRAGRPFDLPRGRRMIA